jgi:hypothetical protein
MNNVVYLEFNNKKSFPKGVWLNEPDFCKWESYKLPCLAIRDMSLGVWKGFVGIDSSHIFHNKIAKECMEVNGALDIYKDVHGGICSAGLLPPKYRDLDKYISEDYSNLWWIGMETSNGLDYMPLLKIELIPGMENLLRNQTYKDFSFIRKEVNKLAKHLVKIK